MFSITRSWVSGRLSVRSNMHAISGDLNVELCCKIFQVKSTKLSYKSAFVWFFKKSSEGKGTVYGRRSRTECLLRTGEIWEICRVECKSTSLHVLPTLRKLDIQFHELCHSLYTGGGGGNKNLSALSLPPSVSQNNGKLSKKMLNCLQSKRGIAGLNFSFRQRFPVLFYLSFFAPW